MKYIFVVGAPGSKWSSVARNIYYSASVDQTDSSTNREYLNQQGGVGHCGAYFDPGMEFELPLDVHMYTKAELASIFDRPFLGTGVRIIKSHTLAHQIDYIKDVWKDCPIILVHRGNDACLDWWIRAGGFNITYPNYLPYYQNYSRMSHCIGRQNLDILMAWKKHTGLTPKNNHELADILDIELRSSQYKQEYLVDDIAIKVI